MLALWFHFFADDSQLWKTVNPRSVSDQFCSIRTIEHSIKSVAEWMFHNKLQLNKDKTEFMIIASKRNHKRICVDHLNLGGDIIKASQTARNLGVVMDCTLSMLDHVNHVRKSGFYYLNWIKRIRNCLTDEAAKAIVHALVISKIDYCNGLLINLPSCVIDKLQHLMNAAARVISRTPRRQSITPVLRQLHWLPVCKRSEFKILCLTFKALNNEAPGYLRELLIDRKPTRNLRSRSSHTLHVPRRKLKCGERSFSFAAPDCGIMYPITLSQRHQHLSSKRSLKLT